MKLKYFSLCWVFVMFISIKAVSQQPFVDPNSLNNAGTTPNGISQPGQQQPNNNFVDTAYVEDTVKVPKKPFSWKNNPTIATIASAILPGAGQFYNKKYWKIPLVWTALGAAGYFYFYNENRYTDFRNAYIYYQMKDPYSSDGFAPINEDEARILYTQIAERYPRLMSDFDYRASSDNNLSTINGNRNLAQTSRDYMMILVLFTYVLNIMDAAVDAHFSTFNVSDDLSMKINPSFVSPTGISQLGMSLTFNFKDNRQKYKLAKTGN